MLGDTGKQDVWGEGVECDERGGKCGARVSLREPHERSTPLDGREGGKVTRGMEELRGRQRPQNHRSPGNTEDTWWKLQQIIGLLQAYPSTAVLLVHNVHDGIIDATQFLHIWFLNTMSTASVLTVCSRQTVLTLLRFLSFVISNIFHFLVWYREWQK